MLTAENELKVPSLPLIRQRDFYERHAKVHEEHSICNLIGKYDDLKKSLENLRNQPTLHLKNYLSVPLPPLAIQIFAMSSNIEAVFENALEVREQYTKLRKSLSQLREDLLDPSIPPFKKNKYINLWKKSWDSLLAYNSSNTNSTLDLATANQVFDINKAISGEWGNVLKPSSILNIMLKYGDNAINKWKVRALHKTAKLYGTTSDKDIHLIIKNIFNYELTVKDKNEYYLIKTEWKK